MWSLSLAGIKWEVTETVLLVSVICELQLYKCVSSCSLTQPTSYSLFHDKSASHKHFNMKTNMRLVHQMCECVGISWSLILTQTGVGYMVALLGCKRSWSEHKIIRLKSALVVCSKRKENVPLGDISSILTKHLWLLVWRANNRATWLPWMWRQHPQSKSRNSAAASIRVTTDIF